MPKRQKEPPFDVIIQKCECGADLHLALFDQEGLYGSYCKRCGRRLPYLVPTGYKGHTHEEV